ncbi:MAG: phosphodiester glycosidase family protein [Lachnospiraceae bacterium]|nr:phosphodiester glycosidase family protein [Lachnospiraceae bacterium]
MTEFFRIIDYSVREAGACIRQMDYVHVLLLAGILAVFVILILRSIWGESEKRMELLWSGLSAAFACLVLLVCVLADASGMLVFEPSDKPQDTVTHFLNCFIAGEDELALADLSNPRQLCYIPTDVDDTGMLYYNALRDSFSYVLLEEPVISKGHASQKFSFSYLDLSRLPAPIYLYVMDDMVSYVDEHPKQEVYDEEENYLPQVLDQVYREGVEHVLESADRYRCSKELTLELDYREGRWYIEAGDELFTAFSGGIAPGANFANNAKSEVLQDLTFIPKQYSIDESVLVAPEPNRDKYGVTDDPAEIRALLAEYPRLTDVDETFWNEDIDIKSKGISYYADDTILVIGWKQLIYNRFCTFAEVYIADGSQIRRKLSEDTYGSPIHKTATNMSKETNAVVAINGDFYKYRTVGITTYQRTLYRFNPGSLEFCHFDSKGNMNFTYAGELRSKAAAEEYIKDNDIIFTLAFGPVLIDDYEIHYSSPNYTLGEVTENYARSSIGQRGPGHYLLMNMNFGYGTPNGTIADSCKIMKAFNCEKAYALDGGQTAEIVLNNQMFNKVDYGGERYVSDLIWFATALPENENK